MYELSKQNERSMNTYAGQSWVQQDSVLGRSLLMDRTVDLLIEKTKAAEFWPELYERSSQVLETLVLPDDEFALAWRHLQNAFAYATNCEYGAAAFELRVLRGQLAA